MQSLSHRRLVRGHVGNHEQTNHTGFQTVRLPQSLGFPPGPVADAVAGSRAGPRPDDLPFGRSLHAGAHERRRVLRAAARDRRLDARRGRGQGVGVGRPEVPDRRHRPGDVGMAGLRRRRRGRAASDRREPGPDPDGSRSAGHARPHGLLRPAGRLSPEGGANGRGLRRGGRGRNARRPARQDHGVPRGGNRGLRRQGRLPGERARLRREHSTTRPPPTTTAGSRRCVPPASTCTSTTWAARSATRSCG